MSNILANIRAKLQAMRYGWDVQVIDLSELKQQDNSTDGVNSMCIIDSHGKVTRTQPPVFEEWPEFKKYRIKEENTMSKITVSKTMATILEISRNWPDFQERLSECTVSFQDAIHNEIESIYMRIDGYADDHEIKRFVYLNLMKHGYTIKKAKKYRVIVAEDVKNSNGTYYNYSYAYIGASDCVTISFCDSIHSIAQVSEDDYKKLPEQFKALAKEVK